MLLGLLSIQKILRQEFSNCHARPEAGSLPTLTVPNVRERGPCSVRELGVCGALRVCGRWRSPRGETSHACGRPHRRATYCVPCACHAARAPSTAPRSRRDDRPRQVVAERPPEGNHVNTKGRVPPAAGTPCTMRRALAVVCRSPAFRRARCAPRARAGGRAGTTRGVVPDVTRAWRRLRPAAPHFAPPCCVLCPCACHAARAPAAAP